MARLLTIFVASVSISTGAKQAEPRDTVDRLATYAVDFDGQAVNTAKTAFGRQSSVRRSNDMVASGGRLVNEVTTGDGDVQAIGVVPRQSVVGRSKSAMAQYPVESGDEVTYSVESGGQLINVVPPEPSISGRNVSLHHDHDGTREGLHQPQKQAIVREMAEYEVGDEVNHDPSTQGRRMSRRTSDDTRAYTIESVGWLIDEAPLKPSILVKSIGSHLDLDASGEGLRQQQQSIVRNGIGSDVNAADSDGRAVEAIVRNAQDQALVAVPPPAFAQSLVVGGAPVQAPAASQVTVQAQTANLGVGGATVQAPAAAPLPSVQAPVVVPGATAPAAVPGATANPLADATAAPAPAAMISKLWLILEVVVCSACILGCFVCAVQLVKPRRHTEGFWKSTGLGDADEAGSDSGSPVQRTDTLTIPGSGAKVGRSSSYKLRKTGREIPGSGDEVGRTSSDKSRKSSRSPRHESPTNTGKQ